MHYFTIPIVITLIFAVPAYRHRGFDDFFFTSTWAALFASAGTSFSLWVSG